MNSFVNSLTAVLDKIDTFVWGPVMLILLVGTGIFLTIRTKALCWRNLPYALKSVLSKEARQKQYEYYRDKLLTFKEVAATRVQQKRLV